jgi:hypothetical protein
MWSEMGYKTCVYIDKEGEIPVEADRVMVAKGEWRGFPHAMNLLCREVPGDVVVCIGDDIRPAPNFTPQSIVAEFLEHFPDTFGVMQPTGDVFGSSEEVCVAPWIGRKFIEEAYHGMGPYNEGYFHYFCDAELQEVATKLGAFYQRSDLYQYHDHWQRDPEANRPLHLMEAKDKWKANRDLFEDRKKNGFPGHERRRHGDD